MKKIPVNEEIDFIEVILTIWQNKWKIVFITASILIIGYLYQNIQDRKITYTAVTEIKPISAFDEFKYDTYNLYIDRNTLEKKSSERGAMSETDRLMDNLEKVIKDDEVKTEERVNSSFQKINKTFLINLYIDKINQRTILKDAIKKFELIKEENYDSIQIYENEVSKLAASVELLPPKLNALDEEENRLNWQIRFKTANIDKWNNLLKYIEKPINEEVRVYLKEVYEKLVLDEKILKNYKIEDLDQNISNSLENYEKEIESRLAFLDEQAEIARKLNIAKNTLVESQASINVGILSDLSSEIPYYLRGYEVIEKEIELIKNRKNKEAFIKNLNDLEVEKKNLMTNKDIERFENLIEGTPISKPDLFIAGNINYLSTFYESKKNPPINYIILYFIIGIIFAIIYAILEKEIKKRR